MHPDRTCPRPSAWTGPSSSRTTAARRAALPLFAGFAPLAALPVRGAEKPKHRFGLLEVVMVVPRKEVDYPASMGGGELGPYKV